MAEGKQGTVIISPAVLATIARLTTLAVPGVVRVSPWSVSRLFGGRSDHGVRVQVNDETVVVNIYVIAQAGVNLLELSREIQHKVTRAIHDIVGMGVQEVNIHILDVLDAEDSKV
jgi:uncharacterized alkaline shock family protein YloU